MSEIDTEYCAEYQRRNDAHIFHHPEYDDEWDEIPDEAKDDMSDEEIRGHLADPDAEQKIDDDWEAWQNGHLESCTNRACRALYLRRKEAGLQQ